MFIKLGLWNWEDKEKEFVYVNVNLVTDIRRFTLMGEEGSKVGLVGGCEVVTKETSEQIMSMIKEMSRLGMVVLD